MRGKPTPIPLELPYTYVNPANSSQPTLIYPSVNIDAVDGYLKSRIQYIAVGSNDPAAAARGAIAWKAADGVTNRIFCLTATDLYKFSGTTWTSGKGTNGALTGGVNGYALTRYMNLSGSTVDTVIATNNADKPIQWDYTAAQWSTLANAPSKAVAVACLGGRIIYGNTTESGVSWGSRVRWSALNDMTTYPATAYADLVDTADNIVSIRTIARNIAVVYKERSIWLMTATGGSDAAAFRFEILAVQAGPIGVNGVTDGPQGTHWYLGRDCNVYMCDGTRVKRLASLSNTMRSLVNTTLSAAVAASFNVRDGMLLFSVPFSGSVIDRALAYNLATKSVYLQQYPNGITALANLPGIIADERVLLCHNARMLMSVVNEASPTDLTASGFEAQILLPVIVGQEWEVQGVDITLAPVTRSDNLQVSWLTGGEMDTLAETNALTFALSGVSRIKANLPVGLRNRIAVLRLLQTPAPNAVPITITRIDAYAWSLAEIL